MCGFYDRIIKKLKWYNLALRIRPTGALNTLFKQGLQNLHCPNPALVLLYIYVKDIYILS